MKLNLGCGQDIRDGYVNVDFRATHPSVKVVDLSKLPWPFPNQSADEIMMLDFLEHFPYRRTELILLECWRVLKGNGQLTVQVPDFALLATSILQNDAFYCNRCGKVLDIDNKGCPCGARLDEISDAAVERLFGGQNYEGNTHYTTFTKKRLTRLLRKNGFGDIQFVERNQNGETHAQNWNMMAVCRKEGEIWSDE